MDISTGLLNGLLLSLIVREIDKYGISFIDLHKLFRCPIHPIQTSKTNQFFEMSLCIGISGSQNVSSEQLKINSFS